MINIMNLHKISDPIAHKFHFPQLPGNLECSLEKCFKTDFFLSLYLF